MTASAQAAAAVSASATVGLPSAEAAARLERFGPNELSSQPRRRWWSRAGRTLKEPLVLVLLAAAVLTTITGDVPDTLVILLVIVVNTVVSVWQEVQAERAVTALSSMTAPVARVVRDGTEQHLLSAQLVPGDAVRLAEGDVVPADGVLVDAAALRVDESSLTGEAVPVDKWISGAVAGPVGSVAAPTDSEEPADPHEQVWAGTTVVHGRATAVVTRTGTTAPWAGSRDCSRWPRSGPPSSGGWGSCRASSPRQRSRCACWSCFSGWHEVSPWS